MGIREFKCIVTRLLWAMQYFKAVNLDMALLKEPIAIRAIFTDEMSGGGYQWIEIHGEISNSPSWQLEMEKSRTLFHEESQKNHKI